MSKELDDIERGPDYLTERERAKLPAWAKDRLARALREKAVAERKYRDQFDSAEPTTIAYGDYQNPRFLPESPFSHQVAFSLDGTPDPAAKVRIVVRRQRDVTTGEEYVDVTGSRGLAVVPQASNVVRLYPFSGGEIPKPRAERAAWNAAIAEVTEEQDQ